MGRAAPPALRRLVRRSDRGGELGAAAMDGRARPLEV